LNKLVQLATRLTEQFIAQNTSIQILSKVSLPDSNSVEGTLENISQVIEDKKPPMPALVIIGKNVVRLNAPDNE